MRLGDPAGGPVPAPVLAEPGAAGLVAVAGADLRAWADPADPSSLRVARGAGAAATLALPGPALRVWAAPGLVAVLSRAGAGHVVTRVDAGARRPAGAAGLVGRPGAQRGGGRRRLAIADGRRVLAARGARGDPTGDARPGAGSTRWGSTAGGSRGSSAGARSGLRVGIVRLAVALR